MPKAHTSIRVQKDLHDYVKGLAASKGLTLTQGYEFCIRLAREVEIEIARSSREAIEAIAATKGAQ